MKVAILLHTENVVNNIHSLEKYMAASEVYMWRGAMETFQDTYYKTHNRNMELDGFNIFELNTRTERLEDLYYISDDPSGLSIILPRNRYPRNPYQNP